MVVLVQRQITCVAPESIKWGVGGGGGGGEHFEHAGLLRTGQPGTSRLLCGACKQFIMWDGLGWALGNPESLSKLYALKFARSLLL